MKKAGISEESCTDRLYHTLASVRCSLNYTSQCLLQRFRTKSFTCTEENLCRYRIKDAFSAITKILLSDHTKPTNQGIHNWQQDTLHSNGHD